MRALLLLLLGAFAGVAPATAQIDASSPVAHPGLDNGEYDAVREDWLRALETDPAAPLAEALALRVAEIDPWCTQPLDGARLARVHGRLSDPHARRALAELRQDALTRRLARGEDVDGALDVYGEWLREWRVAGPWGRLEAPQPLAAPAPLDGLTWTPARRQANRDWILPDAFVHPEAGGVYAAVLMRGEPGDARLLLDADESFLAWWNGEPVAMRLRTGLTDTERQHEATVRLGPGWNLLLVATPGGSALYLGARLARLDGMPLEIEELDAAADVPPGFARLEPSGVGFIEGTRALPEPRDEEDRLLAMHLERLRDRADRALLLDALAERPGDRARAVPRLRAIHLALQENRHLPYEVTRARMVALEEELLALDALDPRVGHARASRLLEEDQPIEALELLRALQARYPACLPLGLLEADTLATLDADGVLAENLLRELAEAFPGHAAPREALRDLAGQAGARAEEERWALRAQACGASGTDNWDVLLDRASRRNDGGLDTLRALADRWRAAEPANGTAEWLHLRCLALAGDDAAALDEYRLSAEQSVAGPDAWLSLGEEELRRHGRGPAATSALREALQRSPSAHEARVLLEALGEPPDAAEAFFAAFGPDVDAALARRGTASGTSTALLLDHGMAFALPDGGLQYRTHVVAEALDRAGTEILHEQVAAEFPLATRVHDASGRVFEPHQVEGTWVMPSLDPGDVVERVWDRYAYGLPGTPPSFGSWRFASFSEPFLLSRWVLYVPDDVAGELRLGNFDGSHETLRWGDGTVHVLVRENSARVEPELLMPSELEVLPWAEFGSDAPEEDALRGWWDWLRWQSSEPADIAAELSAFAAERGGDGDVLARARALHAAVTEHVLDFGEDGDVTDVWTQRRGDPTGLLAALLRHADVPFEWAMAAPTADELDPTPVLPFASGARFAVPLLRVETEDGQVVWLRAAVRGTAFGDLPTSMAGAQVRVLEPHPEKGPLALSLRPEWIPLHGVEDAWDLDFRVRFEVDGDDAATEGSIRITGAQGAALREQLAQAPPEQLQAAARQICAGLVDGLDLEQADFPDLQDAGAPLRIQFAGRVPGFVRTNAAGAAGARTRLPELGLSGGLGSAERSLPFAFRETLRMRAEVVIVAGDGWTLEYGPQPRSEERDGFLYRFEVDKSPDRLRLSRLLEMRGLLLSATEFPAFLELLAGIEKEESRAVQLIPVQ